jgi:excisionase family DNA binding protein
MNDLVRLPHLLSETQAAAALGVSVPTMQRRRRRREIGFIRNGGKIRYTEEHLAQYLLDQEVPPCREDEKNDPAKSGATGSAGDRTARCGAARGSTPPRDRLLEHRSALTMLSVPNSRSRGG